MEGKSGWHARLKLLLLCIFRHFPSSLYPTHSLAPPHLPPSSLPTSISLSPTQKVGAYAFLMVGWSSLAWLMSTFWGTFLELVVQNWQFSLGYIVVSGLLSFAYVYWQGPISNPRSLTVLQWTLQTVALLLICWSFQSNILSVLAIITLLLVQNFRLCVKDYLAFKW